MAEKQKIKPKAAEDKVRRLYWVEGEGLAEIKQWLDNGLFDKQIAKNIGITQKTLIEWKDKYPTLRTMFLTARKAAVHEVVNALYRSALGFHEKEQVIDNKGKKQIVNKYYPPNVAAGIFLAKNWAAGEYKDKWDVDVNGKLPIVLTGDDEIAD